MIYSSSQSLSVWVSLNSDAESVMCQWLTGWVSHVKVPLPTQRSIILYSVTLVWAWLWDYRCHSHSHCQYQSHSHSQPAIANITHIHSHCVSVTLSVTAIVWVSKSNSCLSFFSVSLWVCSNTDSDRLTQSQSRHRRLTWSLTQWLNIKTQSEGELRIDWLSHCWAAQWLPFTPTGRVQVSPGSWFTGWSWMINDQSVDRSSSDRWLINGVAVSML